MGLLSPEPVIEAVLTQYALPPVALTEVRDVLRRHVPEEQMREVITLYESGAITFQFMGFQGPVSTDDCKRLLMRVVRNLPNGNGNGHAAQPMPSLLHERIGS